MGSHRKPELGVNPRMGIPTYITTHTLGKSFLLSNHTVCCHELSSCPTLRRWVRRKDSRLRFLEGGSFCDLTQARNVRGGSRDTDTSCLCPPLLPHPLPDRWTGNGRGQLNKPGTVKGSACLCLLSGHGDTWGTVGFYPQCAHDCDSV